ncbi:MAG: hypothetical protein ABIQ76_03840, partial [Candidatus Limnocylindrales bacterium]
GRTTIRSAPIIVPADPGGLGRHLAFRWTFGHGPSSTADTLKVFLENGGGVRTQVFLVSGNATTVKAGWHLTSIALADPAAQTVRVVIQATDGGHDSLIEIGIDDVRITRNGG